MSIRNLIDLPLEEACRIKYEAGVIEHRSIPGTPFVGHPLIELDLEYLDAISYAREATQQGYNMGVTVDTLMALRRKVQDIYRNQKPRTKAQET